MLKLKKCIFLALFIALFCPGLIHAEEITITTYYPSPYGVYNALQTDKFAVGDNSGDGSFTSADVPTDSGDVWIAGQVGIGTITPVSKLSVGDGGDANYGITSVHPTGGIYGQANDATGVGVFGWGAQEGVWGTSGNGGAGVLGHNSGSGFGGVFSSNSGPALVTSGGNVGFGTSTPGVALDVAGQIRMSGLAGSKMVLDVAEVIPVADDVEEGDVVCIDSSVQKYQFAKSKTADSQLVAGIISSTSEEGKSVPALFVGDAEQKQKDNPGQKYKYLTIAGQIAVKVCLEGGTIKKGDLLSSSSLSGYAMKSQGKQLGTIIGKALEDFDGKDGDKGIIIALLNLM